MKKILAIAAVLSVMALSLTACGNDTTTTDETTSDTTVAAEAETEAADEAVAE